MAQLPYRLALLLLFLAACSNTGQQALPCDQITDWHECEEASHCAPTHEDPVDPDGPTFSCLPADR